MRTIPNGTTYYIVIFSLVLIVSASSCTSEESADEKTSEFRVRISV